MGEEDGGVGVGRRKEEIEGEGEREFACFCVLLLGGLPLDHALDHHDVLDVLGCDGGAKMFRC